MESNWHNRITYIQPGDKEAWVDFQEPKKFAPAFMSENAVQCSTCRSYGGWNLLLNAYPLAGKNNTSENRHIYAHMTAVCHGCAGHGWVRDSDKNCVHELRWAGTDNSLTHFACVHCKTSVSWDMRRKK